MSAHPELGCFTGLPAALKRLVKRSLLSQKEIARRAGVLESSLSKYLSGENNPTLGALGRLIEDGLGLTLRDLATVLQEERGESAPASGARISVDELEDQVRALLLRLRSRAEGEESSPDEPWEDDF